MSAKLLKDYAVTHGGIRNVMHPQLGMEVKGQTAVRYMRFLEPVKVERLELPRAVYGRWVPSVPTHPAHLVISILDRGTNQWKRVRAVDLPMDPDTAGAGLSQDMSMEEIEAHFARILQKPPYRISLEGLETDHLRVECDLEHPVWPSHGECNGGPFNVPYGILNPLCAYGTPLQNKDPEVEYQFCLSSEEIHPVAPEGMRVQCLPHEVRFTSDRLSVGFSLRRPLLTHLGWDELGQGQANQNRLSMTKTISAGGGQCLLSGPVFRTLTWDADPQRWTGRVAVCGNRVIYSHLHFREGFKLEAAFTVEADRLRLELTQTCTQAMPVLEAEAWRLAWNMKAGITGAAAIPALSPGRNGEVQLPALWASDGVGCLSCRMIEGDPEADWLQVESYRDSNCVTGGFVLAATQHAGGPLVLHPGTHRAVFELAVNNLEPIQPAGAPPLSEGLRRHWATPFACFRPELRGFSNNAISTNCQQSQAMPLEMIVHTQIPECGPDPLALARFTVERALLDGGGYGYWRNLYLDSDPTLVSSAGRIHQAKPEMDWLHRIQPGLIAAVERMLANQGEEGLLICRDLSGNSGSHRWSTNAMDVIGFGHLDAYVNAWAYRAFRNAAALFSALDSHKLAVRCREAATAIKAVYGPQFLNPATGWIAGWRSRDGELHDYAFIWVNGVALAFGLLEAKAARHALMGLEQLRQKVGMSSAYLGLPFNLIPIRREDHMLPGILGGAQPTFENYTDGGINGWTANYYLRALSIYGLKEQAQKMAAELGAGYAAGIHNGGNGTGTEFRSWDGIPNGYEGTLIGCFGGLYAIAIEQGNLIPSNPEWWPADGNS